MRTLQWQKAPYRRTRDCYCDVDASSLGPGRWYVKQGEGRNRFYVLRFNSKIVKRFEHMIDAKKFAEAHTQ